MPLGTQNGLACSGYTNQACFLAGLGFRDQLLQELLSAGNDVYSNYKKYDFIMKHLFLDMGGKMKVLIQQKGLPLRPLKGLKSATPILEAARLNPLRV